MATTRQNTSAIHDISVGMLTVFEANSVGLRRDEALGVALTVFNGVFVRIATDMDAGLRAWTALSLVSELSAGLGQTLDIIARDEKASAGQ